jgi:predicted RNase H-like nuclease (RuvC/YqgF family)
MFVLLTLATLGIACAKMPPSPMTEFPSMSKMRESTEAGQSVESDRLVIAEATIELQSLQPDTVHARVIDMAFVYGGYVLSSEDGSTAIRIPASSFKDAIREIEKLGEVTAEKITGQDVTESFRDLQTRLDNTQKTRQRYLSLLDMAKNIEEVLMLEKELERLSREIETYKGKIERLEHLVEYCTITVKTSQEIRPGPASYLFYGLYSGIRWMFVWN